MSDMAQQHESVPDASGYNLAEELEVKVEARFADGYDDCFKCEGCGSLSTRLYEDDGMNLLCGACIALLI